MIIDCHGHCALDPSVFMSADDTVESLDLYGVDKIAVSLPSAEKFVTPQQVRKYNDEILGSMQKYPDRILGYCFVHPGYAKETQDEITRCIVDGGMIGVKLYYQYTMNDPVQFPLIERCIDLGVPILMHAGYPAAPELKARQPNLTTGEHYADVANRYPEALFICGHLGGGGDWERQLKGLREAPTVYVDTSGSVIDAGMIERAVRELGAKRLLFGCDLTMARGLGKILDANVTARQRGMIFSENFLKLLARRTI